MSQRPRQRSIDFLRGVCLLGILVMNIQSFAMPHAAYLNPTVFGSLEGLDGLAWGVGRVLFDFKFLNLFAMLFGASLLLGGEETRPRVRLRWLIGFGLIHAYGVWYGDVLFTYGVVGLLALGARGWSAGRQAAVGAGLVLVGPALTALYGLCFDRLPGWLLQAVLEHLDARSVPSELAAFRGGWLEQLPVRARLAFEGQTTGLVLDTGWRAAGCMLLGMAALQRGVFEGWRPGKLVLGMAWGLGLGLTGAGLGLQWSSGFAPRAWVFAQAIHELGAVPLAMAIGLAVLAIERRGGASAVVDAVANLGRMAFSAYLMHSLVGTLVFGGHGLGLFGTWGRGALLVAAFVFWSGQVLVARWWAARFRVGPLEALWRGLVRGDFSLGARSPEASRGGG